MTLTWLADVARTAGLDVREVDGWRTRGVKLRNGQLAKIDPRIVVDHHTASRQGSPNPSLRICTYGRSDLAGPLCNILIGRDSTVWIIAAGQTNNAGRISVPQFNAFHNAHTIGVEIENDGIGEPWTDQLCDTSARLDAAICAHLGWTAERCIAHKEAAIPRGRKTDPSWDQNEHRARVAKILTDTGDEMALAKYMTKGLAMQRLEQVCRKHRDADMSIDDRRWLEADTDARIAKGEPIAPLIDWWDAALYAEGA